MNLGFSRALGLASRDCLVQDCLGVRSQKGGIVTSMEKGLVKRPGSVLSWWSKACALSWWSKALITKLFYLTYYPLNVPGLAERFNFQVLTDEEREAHKE